MQAAAMQAAQAWFRKLCTVFRLITNSDIITGCLLLKKFPTNHLAGINKSKPITHNHIINYT